MGIQQVGPIPTQIVDQPPPVGNDRPAIQDLVLADIAERKRIGIERYGKALQPHNGRDALVDAYQEVLDLAMYVRQEIEERADAAAEERAKIVCFARQYAAVVGIDSPSTEATINDLAAAIERGEHRDTVPAPPSDDMDDSPDSQRDIDDDMDDSPDSIRDDDDDDLDGADTATGAP